MNNFVIIIFNEPRGAIDSNNPFLWSITTSIPLWQLGRQPTIGIHSYNPFQQSMVAMHSCNRFLYGNRWWQSIPNIDSTTLQSIPAIGCGNRSLYDNRWWQSIPAIDSSMTIDGGNRFQQSITWKEIDNRHQQSESNSSIVHYGIPYVLA